MNPLLEWVIKGLTLGFAGFGVGWALVQLRHLVDAQTRQHEAQAVRKQEQAWSELRDRVRQQSTTWPRHDSGDAA